MTNLQLPPMHPTTEAHDTSSVRPHNSLRHARRALLILLALLAIGAALRLANNAGSAQALVERNQQSLQRTVLTAQPVQGNLERTLVLPATLRGNSETSIYARSNGYLTQWYKDIGDTVTKGELLALIDAPEQTQELAQVRANRQQVLARRDLAQLTLVRWESLREHDGVSQQELEEKRSALAQARADLAAVEASVSRLEQLESFRRIVAPFDGVVTRRDAEVGDLISTSSAPLFRLTQTHPVRLSVWVPQLYAGDLIVGTQARVTLNGDKAAPIAARIERIAGSIDPRTRARQVELVIAEPTAQLLPGSYAEVSLVVASNVPALIVPASVLKVTSAGIKIAVVDEEQRIGFRDVQLGRDLGREVEVLSGISLNETLVVSPSDLLEVGEPVKTLAWTGKVIGGNGQGVPASAPASQPAAAKAANSKDPASKVSAPKVESR